MNMRLPIAAAALATLACCNPEKVESKSTAGLKVSGAPDESASLKSGLDEAIHDKPVGPAVIKKPIDTRPLPTLIKATGGATGKPRSGTSFGGLGVDTPKDLALAGLAPRDPRAARGFRSGQRGSCGRARGTRRGPRDRREDRGDEAAR